MSQATHGGNTIDIHIGLNSKLSPPETLRSVAARWTGGFFFSHNTHIPYSILRWECVQITSV